ncbi:uncharacterized protein [Blastocystis hominis]|uniref:Uncharacterized protein n=1 Tax=Blastocystis hominis TaxID=12968 RepID=D8M0M8_BLAHO|nr:uncharacterized protein [Blastocystis hominis]CBK21617.2 unnamed protein product [Blastocystis hominis]|eukprot:XP_012895665.1 uncharacterized protein [Blastocystis hominis]
MIESITNRRVSVAQPTSLQKLDEETSQNELQLQLKRKGVFDNLRRLEAEGKLKRTQERKERTEKSMEEIERRMKKIQELRSKPGST